MAKIIFITPELNIATGTLRVVNLWANYLSNHTNHAITIVSNITNPSYYPFTSNVDVKQYGFNFNLRIINIPYNLIQLYRYLNSLSREETIHLIIDKSLLIEPLWILKKMRLFENINFIYFTHAGSSAFKEFYLSRSHTKHRVKMMFEAFDKVVCLFDDEKNYPTMVKEEKLLFLSNPIPFEPSSVNIEKKENIILYLGRVEKKKGIDTLLEAWALVDQSEWKLQIVGDGIEKEEFKLLAKELDILNSVEFIKSQVDVKKYYNKSKIFVLPSIFEGMPMVILEAMACKATVISSDTAGGLRLIEENQTGLLFKKGDKYELAKKINYLIRDKNQRNKLANNAYIYINKHSIKTVAPNWIPILNE